MGTAQIMSHLLLVNMRCCLCGYVCGCYKVEGRCDAGVNGVHDVELGVEDVNALHHPVQVLHTQTVAYPVDTVHEQVYVWTRFIVCVHQHGNRAGSLL